MLGAEVFLPDKVSHSAVEPWGMHGTLSQVQIVIIGP